jgi:CheY-like chemotaxis protein
MDKTGTIKKTINILFAEDDEDYYLLIKDAFEQFHPLDNLNWVKDGEELMDYLFRKGQYEDQNAYPQPGLILLDLNMPKKDGREALKEIKNHPKLKNIPVVILTTSKEEEDVELSYRLGANAYIRKPLSFNRLVEIVKSLKQFWFEVVELPKST